VLFCALLLVGAARNVLPSHLRRAGYPIPVEHDVAPLQLGVIALEEPLHSVDAGLLEKTGHRKIPAHSRAKRLAIIQHFPKNRVRKLQPRKGFANGCPLLAAACIRSPLGKGEMLWNSNN